MFARLATSVFCSCNGVRARLWGHSVPRLNGHTLVILTEMCQGPICLHTRAFLVGGLARRLDPMGSCVQVERDR